MRISSLYTQLGPLFGKDVYLVGTGPSMAVFPLDYLTSRCCILLNDASRVWPMLGPIAFSNHRQWIEPVLNPKLSHIVVKGRFKSDPEPERDDNHVPWDHPKWHVFSYRERPWDTASHTEKSSLWAEPDHYWNLPGGTVAIFACQFAALAGAKSITLVGCDCTSLQGQDYGLPGLVAIKQARHDYASYAAGLRIMQRALAKRFRIPLLTLTPFCGLGREQEQYIELLKERQDG